MKRCERYSRVVGSQRITFCTEVLKVTHHTLQMFKVLIGSSSNFQGLTSLSTAHDRVEGGGSTKGVTVSNSQIQVLINRSSKYKQTVPSCKQVTWCWLHLGHQSTNMCCTHTSDNLSNHLPPSHQKCFFLYVFVSQ